MLVDYERAFLDLKARLIEKRSWGLRELMVLIAEVEQESRVDDDGFDPAPTRVPAIGGAAKRD